MRVFDVQDFFSAKGDGGGEKAVELWSTLAFVAATIAVLWGSLALKLPELVTKKVKRYSFTIRPLFNRPRGRLTTAR